MGGLPRRAAFIEQEKAEGSENLILDTGNFVASKPLPEQSLEPARIKAELILKAMDAMGYSIMAIGERDLYLGLDHLRTLSDMTRVRFLSANLTDSTGKTLFKPYRILKVGGVKVGVIGLTAVPADQRMFQRRVPDVSVEDPFSAAGESVDSIRKKCDLLVVLSNIGYAGDLRLAETVPGIDIIVSGGTKRYMKKPIRKNSTLVTSGYYEGRAIGKLTVHFDGTVKGWISREELDFLDKQIQTAEEKMETPNGKKKYDTLFENRGLAEKLTLYEPDMVNLDPSFPDDPEIAALISDYRKGLIKSSGSSPDSGAVSKEQLRYTGSKECARCHESRYRFWLNTGHSRAFESLAPKNAGADPDCIGCHVTGYKRRTGYWPKAPKEELRGVQCEACHGVGSLHVGNPDSYSLVHLPAAPRCMDCHTENQDDDFDYFRDKSLVCGEK